MGIHDRDWYRQSRPSMHWWHDMPTWAKFLVIIIGMGVLASIVNSARHGGAPYYDEYYYDEDAMILDVFDAVEYGSVTHAAKFLQQDPAQVALRDEATGAQPLHRAATYGQAAMIRLLIKFKADVRAPDDRGRTPLHYAAEAGNVEAARVLLDEGADVNAMDESGDTPLLAAAAGERMMGEGIIDLLREHGAEYNLRAAALLGDLEYVTAQLKKDPQCLADHPQLDQMLVDAIEGINREAIRRWMERMQTNPTATMFSSYGQHPYDSADVDAEVARRLPLVKLLIEHGADVNDGDADQPPLFAAASVFNIAIAKELLDHGAKANIRLGSRTPLKIAVQMQNQEVARLLRKAQ